MDRYKISKSDPIRKPVLKEKTQVIMCPECNGNGQGFELKICTKCGGIGKIAIPMHACQICGDETGQCKHICSICGDSSGQCAHLRPLSDKEMNRRYVEADATVTTRFNNEFGEIIRFLDEWRGHINNTYIDGVGDFSYISQVTEPVPGTGILGTTEDIEANRQRILNALGVPPEYIDPPRENIDK